MKKWLAIVGFCVFLIPCAYGETINYDGGDKYVGDVSNGVPHGDGTYFYVSGEKYIGEWKDGLNHGDGTYFYVSGSKYIGEWKDGVEWAGIQYTPDGLVQGNFIEGVWQGEEFDCVKEREYIEDGKNMIDCEFYDGERYVGGYEGGMWTGQGTYFYVSGSKYIGEWKDGDYHGHGTFFFAGGEKYIGEYKDGSMYGHGIYIWPDGTKYTGEFKGDLFHGHAIYAFADGAKYVGEWKDDYEWTGIQYYADGTVEGTYSNGEWISK